MQYTFQHSIYSRNKPLKEPHDEVQGKTRGGRNLHLLINLIQLGGHGASSRSSGRRRHGSPITGDDRASGRKAWNEKLEREGSGVPALLLAPSCWCEIWTNDVIRTSRMWCGNENEKLNGNLRRHESFKVVQPPSGVIAYVHYLCDFSWNVLQSFFPFFSLIFLCPVSILSPFSL